MTVENNEIALQDARDKIALSFLADVFEHILDYAFDVTEPNSMERRSALDASVLIIVLSQSIQLGEAQ
jgi:hypothetical protein